MKEQPLAPFRRGVVLFWLTPIGATWKCGTLLEFKSGKFAYGLLAATSFFVQNSWVNAILAKILDLIMFGT